MPDETPTNSDLEEFGDPSTNSLDVSRPDDVIRLDPDAAFTDEVPDLGLE